MSEVGEKTEVGGTAGRKPDTVSLGRTTGRRDGDVKNGGAVVRIETW